jgi:conjugal transfer pilus assembly protein TraK
MLLGDPAHALQIVDAQDGQTALAKLSRKEVTRIAFERGRVRKVTGSAGEFVLEKDDEKGQIFVRPTDPQSTKPINLFLTSERGTVALLLQPVDTPSDSIVIREPRERSSGAHPAGGQWPARPHAQELAAATGRRRPARGHAGPGACPRHHPVAGHPAHAAARAAGVRRGGREVPVDQHGNTILELAETALFKSGVMAVSLEQPSLRPGETTNLFVIRERKNDD